MNKTLLFDCTDTCHCHAHSGVQRVVRSLFRHLSSMMDCKPVLYDRYESSWRQPEGEEKNLIDWNQSGRQVRSKRGARWTLPRKLKSLMRRRGWLSPGSEVPMSDGFFTAEIFSLSTQQAFPDIFRRADQVKVAVFHDAIAVKFPDWYPSATVESYGAYMRGLAEFDGILAVSRCSANDLRQFWEDAGIRKTPRVEVLPLGADVPESEMSKESAERRASRPVALFVSTFETRKNHLELLRASRKLWQEGLDFELCLVGGSQKRSGKVVENEIRSLQKQGFPVRWEGPVSEARLNECYREASFIVYPSLYEGFGLPVIEAMKRGKPVVMTDRGALSELIEGGGCVVSSGPDAAALSEAMAPIIRSPDYRDRLRLEASTRTFPDWRDSAGFVADFLTSLPQRKARP